MTHDVIEYYSKLRNTRDILAPPELEQLIQKPINALTYLGQQAKLESFNCPAVVDSLKNVYYITSPVDFSIVRDNAGNFSILRSEQLHLDLSGCLHVAFPDKTFLYERPMLTINLQYTFINKDNDVIMEVIDPPLVHNGLTNMPGEFNISRWVRPTNFCFFVDPNIDQLDISKGDPLYAVRFRSKTNTFRLVEVVDEARRLQIFEEQKKALSIKIYKPNLKLSQMYDLFKERMASLWH